MRAARYYGKEDIRIEEIPEPKLGPGQIKIAPAFVGICGTDLHEYLGGPNFCPTKPHPVTKEQIPVTLGHEFSGTVKEVKEPSPFKIGDKVVVQPSIFCSECTACRGGAENVCHKSGFIGLSGGGGGLSDSVCVPADAVLKLPDNVPLDVGALVEPLSVAWHAVSASKAKSEHTALVLGGGPIGLAVVQCLVAKGVKKIIVSEIAKRRQEFAKEFGAHRVLNPRTDDVVKIVKAATGGAGADIVFDCAGLKASLDVACTAVKVRGSVVNVAIWEKEIMFQPNMLVFSEATYTAVLGYQRPDWVAVLDSLKRASGIMKPANMITRKIKLEDLVEKGILALTTDKDNQVKILVDIQG
ncbi:GroES-like protein [Microthyrium microscopicum]|uniref:GroES-like protein n=1 Tax=Microthyrium microscopicum TaxID=703497 RepID=A0A6A6U630_9PEZI|nr:GroES-like protein [Microthyrium microscopicum]